MLDFDILNAISKHQRIALDFAYSCDENLFYNDNAKKLAKAFLTYIKIYRNKPSRRVLLDRYSTDDILCEIINNFFDKYDDIEYKPEEYQYDLERLKDRFGQNHLEDIRDKLNNEDLVDVKSGLSIIEREVNLIKSINSKKAYDRQPIKNYVDDFRNSFIEKSKNPNVGKGILTGYSFFDYVKNGLRPADLIIIGGDTGSGKSMWMNNMAIQIWMQNNKFNTPPDQYEKGYNITYFSLEMPYEDCFRRTLARLADVREHGIRDAKLSQLEAIGMANACKFIKKYPYQFDIVDVPRGFSVSQLEVMYEQIKSEYIPDVIFIDYLSLMEGITDAEDWLALGELAGRIHEFARVNAIPVITAVQLNRIDPTNNKSQTKSVGLHRIGRSALIATHATVIMQIEKREDEESHDSFNYTIVKNRSGLSGKGHSILKNLSKCSIIDLPYDPEILDTWSPGEDLSNDIVSILGTI